MSAVLTEYVFEYAFRYGLDHIYNNQSILEEIFSQFKDDYLLSRYGQAHLDNIKQFINEQKINIYHSWRLDQFETPSYTISLSSEGEIYKSLQDTHPSSTTDIPSSDIATNINILSYDTVSGYLYFDLATDFSTINTGIFFEDSDTNSFELLGPIVDRPTEKKIFIGFFDTPPVLGIGKFITGSKTKRENFGSLRLSNSIEIGIHHTEPHIVKYLYYIALYVLNRFKKTLFEDRGVELSTYSATETIRLDQMTPDHLFTRSIMVGCFTEYVWPLGEEVLPTSGFFTRSDPGIVTPPSSITGNTTVPPDTNSDTGGVYIYTPNSPLSIIDSNTICFREVNQK